MRMPIMRTGRCEYINGEGLGLPQFLLLKFGVKPYEHNLQKQQEKKNFSPSNGAVAQNSGEEIVIGFMIIVKYTIGSCIS